MVYQNIVVSLQHKFLYMTKEEKIQEYMEYVMIHLNDIIPYDTPNYEEVLMKEARHCAEAMYEMETKPQDYTPKSTNEPLLEFDELPF